MRRWLVPSEMVSSVYTLDLSRLRRQGIEGLLLDLDNTLVPWGGREASPALIAWIAKVRASGLRPCIVTNNFTDRVEAVARVLGVQAVTGAAKPTPGGLRRAMRLLGTTPATTALVGDQLFTDILGGNLLGLYTILVTPLGAREFPTTRLVRLVEALVLPWVRRAQGARRVPPGAGRSTRSTGAG